MRKVGEAASDSFKLTPSALFECDGGGTALPQYVLLHWTWRDRRWRAEFGVSKPRPTVSHLRRKGIKTPAHSPHWFFLPKMAIADGKLLR